MTSYSELNKEYVVISWFFKVQSFLLQTNYSMHFSKYGERTSGVLSLSHIVVLNASFGGSMTCPKFYFRSPIFITIGKLILKTLSRHMYALAQNYI